MVFDEDFNQKNGSNMGQKTVLPPYTNRGAVNTSESGLRSLVDWVSLTLKNVEIWTDVADILGIPSDMFRECEKGGFSYRSQVRFGHIAIYYNGREDMGIHVEMSGQGCREFETFSSINWSTLFALLLNFDVKISRLDIAIDDFRGYFKIDTLKRKIRDGAVRSKFRSATEIRKSCLKDGTSLGDTLYFGSPQSMVQIRFYDKYLEQEAKNKKVNDDVEVWNRVEVQLRDDRAYATALILAYEERSVGSCVTGLLSNYINFCVKSKDTNKGRWKICKFWTDFLGDAEKLQLSQLAPDRSIERSKDWIERQATPTLAMLYEAFQGDMQMFYNLLIDGIGKLDTKHLDMLNRFYKDSGQAVVSKEEFYERKQKNISNLIELTNYENYFKHKIEKEPRK
jgi:phage replication initiation protein